jgi:hypothetical protein
VWDQILILDTVCWSLSLWLSSLCMKQGNLFCFVLFCYAEMKSPKAWCFMLCSHIFGKLLMSKGCTDLVWDCLEKTIDYWIIFSMKTK